MQRFDSSSIVVDTDPIVVVVAEEEEAVDSGRDRFFKVLIIGMCFISLGRGRFARCGSNDDNDDGQLSRSGG